MQCSKVAPFLLFCLLIFPAPGFGTEGSDSSAEPTGGETVRPEDPVSQGRDRIVHRTVSLIRVNPLGLQAGMEIAFQHRLFDSDSVLFRDSFAGFAVAPMLTPAFARFGVAAQVQPLAVLFLEARWNFIGWFGTANHVQTFADSDADFSDSAIAEKGEQGAHGATTGWELDLTAELRARVGPVVARNRTMVIRSELAPPTRISDAHFYDPTLDLLMPTSGWSLTNDADLLLFWLDDRWIAGARHTMALAFDDAARTDSPTHRVGPLVAYKFWRDPGAAFDEPTVFVLMQWYEKNRYRTGGDSHAALPYVAVGFAFKGDLL